MGKAILPLDLVTLEFVFSLPPGYRLISVHYEPYSQIAYFAVQSEAIPETLPGHSLPEMTLQVTVEPHPEQPAYRKMTTKPVLRDVLGKEASTP